MKVNGLKCLTRELLWKKLKSASHWATGSVLWKHCSKKNVQFVLRVLGKDSLPKRGPLVETRYPVTYLVCLVNDCLCLAQLSSETNKVANNVTNNVRKHSRTSAIGNFQFRFSNLNILKRISLKNLESKFRKNIGASLQPEAEPLAHPKKQMGM